MIRAFPGVFGLERLAHAARVHLGPYAGWGALWQEISEWKFEHRFVLARDLEHIDWRALGLVPPHRRIDASRYPWSGRALETVSLVEVDDERYTRAITNGARGLVVGFWRTSAEIRLILDGFEARRIEACLFDIGSPPMGSNEIDRVIRAFTRGMIDELAIRFAMAITRAFGPGVDDPEHLAWLATENDVFLREVVLRTEDELHPDAWEHELARRAIVGGSTVARARDLASLTIRDRPTRVATELGIAHIEVLPRVAVAPRFRNVLGDHLPEMSSYAVPL